MSHDNWHHYCPEDNNGKMKKYTRSFKQIKEKTISGILLWITMVKMKKKKHTEGNRPTKQKNLANDYGLYTVW